MAEPVVIKMTSNDVFSVDQAAKELGRHRATIYRWIDNGIIVGLKFGESFFVPKSEVARLKASNILQQKRVRVEGLAN
jgi:excisionase family DNA binding protein